MKPKYFLLLLAAACTPVPKPCAHMPAGDVVYVVGQGWHAELGIPVEELEGKLAFYREVFPKARVIMFGYGKRTFFIAPVDSVSEYVLGPVPGPAAIHAVGLSVTPPEAYPKDTVTLALPQGGAAALSDYIGKDIAKDSSGNAKAIARSHNPDGLFYAAESEYSLMHTCNTWTAAGLHAAGLPITAKELSFSGQVMAQVNAASQNQCR